MKEEAAFWRQCIDVLGDDLQANASFFKGFNGVDDLVALSTVKSHYTHQYGIFTVILKGSHF